MYRNPTESEMQGMQGMQGPRGGNTAKILVGGVLVAGGIGGLAWWYVQRRKALAAAQSPAALPQVQTGAQAITIAPGLMSQSPQVLQFVPADQLNAQEIAQPAADSQPNVTISPTSTPPPPAATQPPAPPPASPFRQTVNPQQLRRVLGSGAVRFGR